MTQLWTLWAPKSFNSLAMMLSVAPVVITSSTIKMFFCSIWESLLGFTLNVLISLVSLSSRVAWAWSPVICFLLRIWWSVLILNFFDRWRHSSQDWLNPLKCSFSKLKGTGIIQSILMVALNSLCHMFSHTSAKHGARATFLLYLKSWIASVRSPP